MTMKTVEALFELLRHKDTDIAKWALNILMRLGWGV